MRLSSIVLKTEVPPPPEPATVVPGRGPDVVAKMVSARIGEPVDVRGFDMNLVRAAMTEGVLVTMVVRWWRGQEPLSPQDCGFPPGEADSAHRLVDRSHVQLMPPEVKKAHMAAEATLRRALREHGFKIDGYDGYFIPVKQWDDFTAAFKRGKAQMSEAITALAGDDSKLEAHKRGCDREFRRLAVRAWRGHRSTWDELGSAQAGALANVEAPTPVFLDWFSTRFLAQIPSAEIIRDLAEVRYVPSLLYVPEVEAAMEVARGHAALQEELRESLKSQRDTLPMRFIESIMAAAASEVSVTAQRLASSPGRRTGEATRTANAVRKLATKVDGLNLSRDPRIMKAMREMAEGLKMAEARANAAQRAMTLDEAIAPVQRAAEALSRHAVLQGGET